MFIAIVRFIFAVTCRILRRRGSTCVDLVNFLASGFLATWRSEETVRGTVTGLALNSVSFLLVVASHCRVLIMSGIIVQNPRHQLLSYLACLLGLL